MIMLTLDAVKTALRVKSAAYNDEVSGVIAAAFADLKRVGVKVPEWDAASGEPLAVDPLLHRAVILYAKANFGYSDDSEKYNQAYEYLKCALSLAGDYIEVE